MKYRLFLGLLLVLFSVISAEEITLDLLFTNDIHGGIDRYPATFMNPDFPPMIGGGGSAATYIKKARKKSQQENRDNLLIDVGDFFQGHPIGSLSKGKAVMKYMNMVDYDLTVIGNHEYDISEEELKETLSLAKFPVLSCNIVKKGTNELVDYVEPYIVKEIMGVKIGIIGVTTTDTEKMSFPENIKNVDFLPEDESLRKYIKIINEKENPDLIFVAGHLGLPYNPQPAYDKRYGNNKEKDYKRERYWGLDAQELAHEVKGIDLIFGGHMHKGFSKPWEDPVTHTLVIQGYAYGSNVGHLILKIDKETKSISGYEFPAIDDGLLITLFEDEFIRDPVIGDSIAAMRKRVESGFDEVIGEAKKPITKHSKDAQNAIGNLVCEAMLDYAESDFAFINLGGVRDELAKGPITYRDVFNVMPFDNQIVTINVSGEFLKDIIEMRVSYGHHGLLLAGAKVVYNRNRDNYDRVTKLEIGGEPWQKDKIYEVTTSDFLLMGNAGLTMLTKVPEEQIIRYETSLRDVIVDYIKENSPIDIGIDDRWRRDDSSKLSENLSKQQKK